MRIDNLKQRIVVVCGTFIGMFICFSIILLSYSSSILKEKSENYVEEILSDTSESIINNVERLNKSIYSFIYDRTVQDFMFEKRTYKSIEDFKETLSVFNQAQEGVAETVVIRGDDEFIFGTPYGNNESEKLHQLLKIIKLKKGIHYGGIYIDDENKSTYLLVGVDVYGTYRDYLTEKVGSVIFYIKPEVLLPYISKLAKKTDGRYYVVNRDNIPILSYDGQEDNQYFEESQLDNENYIISTREIKQIHGKVIGIIDKRELYRELYNLRYIGLMIIIATVIFSILIYSTVSRKVINPIYELVRFIELIRKGNLKQLKNRVKVSGDKEIRRLGYEFNALLDEVNDLTYRLFNTTSALYEMDLQNKKAELDFLKAQINPHFLYNTLDNIRGMALVYEAKPIQNTAKWLSEIFKYSIKGGDEVYVKEELDIVKAYIGIQKIRFDNRLDVQIAYEEEVLSYRMVKMIIQPIIENAIYHGIEPKLGKTLLQLSLEIESDQLIITVQDDGVGIKRDRLKEVIESMSNPKDEEKFIGIKNVNNRIKLFYGQEYGLEINSKENEGTNVKIRIPIGRIDR